MGALSASVTSLASVYPGKSGQEIWGVVISGFPGSQCRGYNSKDFSGTDIYRSDIKNALASRYYKLKKFLLTKNYFSKFAKFF